MRTQRTDFAEFYRRYNDDCLRTVLVSVGDRHTAQDLVAEGGLGGIAMGLVQTSQECTGG